LRSLKQRVRLFSTPLNISVISPISVKKLRIAVIVMLVILFKDKKKFKPALTSHDAVAL